MVSVVVEGVTDIPVADRLLQVAGHSLGAVLAKGGKPELDRKLAGYNQAALFSPWLVLRDFDAETPCPGDLVRRLLPSPSPQMVFRLAVHEVEAWLLGDGEALAAYLCVTRSVMPLHPESLQHPKALLVRIAGRSRRRCIREDMAPRQGTPNLVGPGYSLRIAEFALRHWRPEIAASTCPSLGRCLTALQRL